MEYSVELEAGKNAFAARMTAARNHIAGSGFVDFDARKDLADINMLIRGDAVESNGLCGAAINSSRAGMFFVP